MGKSIPAAVLLPLIALLLTLHATAQTRTVVGKICGDPTQVCRTRENFQPYELPFDFGKNNVISRSELFYAVILKSVKLKSDDSDCDKAITEKERLNAQKLFPRNMVFVMRCWETGQNSYTNVVEGVSFMGIYAGQTQREANAFLSRMKSSGQFLGATIRRMRIQINGT